MALSLSLDPNLEALVDEFCRHHLARRDDATVTPIAGENACYVTLHKKKIRIDLSPASTANRIIGYCATGEQLEVNR